MNKVQAAKNLAMKWHNGQDYGTLPYMYHLNQVYESLVNAWYEQEFEREPVLVVAYLHDVLEDTLCEESTIEEMFGSEILMYVRALTKVKGETYSDYIATVKSHKVSRLVKIHDTLCNLRQSVFGGDTKRIVKYSKQLQLLVEDNA